MKILAINGSPKGGRSNTYQLTRAFIEGMKESTEETGEALEVREIQANTLEIHPCLGCFSCWNKTPGACCIQDDMRQVIQGLLWADVTIWSFPLYYFTVPGGLKNLIDRQLPMVLPFMVENDNQTGNGSHPSRYDMSGKRTVVISTCGFYTAEGNYDGVCSLFDHICGRDSYTTIFCGQGELFRVPEVSQRTGEYLGYVREAGKEYAAGGIHPETEEKLKELLYPRETFESWADVSWGIDKTEGGRESDALTFTRQMAVLYRKESYAGKSQVLEMYYTDIGECYQILLGAEGSQVITDGSGTATTRIETPLSVWRSIAAGEIRGDEALMKGLYKVKGDFNLMLRWNDYFGAPGGSSDGEGHRAERGRRGDGEQKGSRKTGGIHTPDRETNMNIMLLPWLCLWISVGISSQIGSILTIATCLLVPLVFYRNKKTLYDSLSGVLAGGCSMAVLLGGPVRLLLPLSYLSFGIMWTVTCFGKIPLTAHYSMNDYNGEDALQNPLFLKTNWILTLMWGILYLVTPIWTYFLMGTGLSPYMGAINSLLPALMGIFTVWFQKWYPAKVARGE